MRPFYATIVALFLAAAPLASADCDNGDSQRCDYGDFGACVAFKNGLCPTECEGVSCFPNPDCIVTNQQYCGWACCSFTDRDSCLKCAESSGIHEDICDSADCD